MRLASKLASIASCLAVLAGRAAADDKVVKLRFAWPANVAATVTSERTESPARTAEASFRVQGRMVAEPRGDGISVRWIDWKGNATGAAAAAMRGSEKLAVWVDSSGKVERVMGMQAAVEALRKLPPFDAATPEVSQFLQLAPALFEHGEREDWFWMVELWAGRELTLVKDQVLDRSLPITLFPGAQIRAHVELRAVRWTRCPAPAAGRCVELFAVQEPNRDDLHRVVEDVVQQAKVATDAVEDLLSEDAATLEVSAIVDPATLLPYRVTRTKTTVTRDDAGKPVKTVAVDRQTFKYP